MKYKFIAYAAIVPILAALCLTSCTSGNLVVSRVDYQSIRTTFAQPQKVPEAAKIVSQYLIDPSGLLMVIVYNQTDEILTIDQTKSFFVNTNGSSISYFDPTIHTTTSATYNSSTSGTSFNLGAIASTFGISGSPIGAMLGATSLYDSNTTGTYSGTTVTIQDQPLIHVAPHGKTIMSKQFPIEGVGRNKVHANTRIIDVRQKEAPLKFSVCISYSFEHMTEPDKLITDFYVNSTYSSPVSGGKVNNAFKQIYAAKPDALAENAYIFNIITNLPSDAHATFFGDDYLNIGHIFSDYVHGSLIDYK